MKKRINSLKSNLRKKKCLPYLVSDLNNIRYLTGFAGSYAALIVTAGDSFLISDSRYEEYACSILPKQVKFVLQSAAFKEILKELCKELNIENLFVEDNNFPVASFFELKKFLRKVKLIPGGNEVNFIRMIKDDEEIKILTEAAALTDRCFSHLISMIKPGMTEWDISVEIEYFYRKNGCRKTSFDSIVASGAASSMPHYEPGMNKKIMPGDILLIDMGCEYQGYNSDLTRTFFINSVDPELEKIYMIVKEAQERALEAVKPGISTGRLDKAARDYISEAGYGDNFGHGLGHGYGIEVHELPSVRKNGEIIIKKNMTITIEPGIYIPGKGGVRIEDMVLVTASGGMALTKSTKDMIVI
ncbi:MAG: Xaa-Pro peptidase family protein [Leptospirales bacterium]|nr:Xaa-Pro peptidase family protein [Leptospirales bacterium]